MEAVSDRHRELAASLQHDQAACIARLQATSSRGVRACIRRVAGCATSTTFAGHASTEAGLELTCHLDHPMGSHHWLIGEHRMSGEKKYYLANLPAKTDLRT